MQIPSVSTIKPEVEAEKDWKNKLGKWKDLYDLWVKRPTITEQDDIIDEETYKALQKGNAE